MNHFAHLVLAQPTLESVVGNLMGDFARGVDINKLKPGIRAGLFNHRAVDRFTDTDEQILSLKHLFSSQRRRFAGVALDIYFDHLLINHWHELEQGTAELAISRSYQDMHSAQALMPDGKMRRVTSLMVEHDWFGQYRELEAISRAMNRVAARIRFANGFENAIQDILRNEQTIRDGFLEFYPRLRAHIAELAIEQADQT